MTSLLAFCTALIIVCMMAPSTLQMANAYVQRKEPIYHFYYNVNEPNAGLRKSQEEMRNGNSDGFRQNSDYKTPTQHQIYDFAPKNSETILLLLKKTVGPESSYNEALHPGYPQWGGPMGLQFNPAPGVDQTLHRIFPGYEQEKLPPGYVALVAKIDTPKGYKLLDETN